MTPAEAGPTAGDASITRQPLRLRTQDGLDLAAELTRPSSGPVEATVVAVHPVPTEGGSMDTRIIAELARRLPAQGAVAVVRFNTRGTRSASGASEGCFGGGEAESADLQAAVLRVQGLGLPAPWLLGCSFGADLVLRHGITGPAAAQVPGGVLLSPPLRRAGDADLDRWAVDGRALHVLVPGRDHLLPPDQARERFRRVPQARVVVVDGARHLWFGERYVAQAVQHVVSAAAPR